MIRLAAIAVVAATLMAPAAALAQGDSPFAPLGPSAPPTAPAQVAPPPAQTPQLPRVARPEDDKLAPVEMLALLGMTALLFAAVGVAIVREGRRMERRARMQRRVRRRAGSALPRSR